MRRLNYTGRVKIKQSSVSLSIVPVKGQPLRLKGTIDLQEYGQWPPDAIVVLEARSSSNSVYERIRVGEANSSPLVIDHALGRFDGEHSPGFRVKVIDGRASRGKLLGRCDVRARSSLDDEPSDSMLHVSVEPLDGEIFRLRLEEDRHPVLVINQNLPDTSEFSGKLLAKHPAFISLVMPQLMRTILTDIIVVRDHTDSDDDGPEGKWLKFALQFNPEPIPDKDELTRLREWIDIAVDHFAQANNVLSQFSAWSSP